jgi:hypothetical protein
MRKRSEGRPQGKEISPGRGELSRATTYASTPAAVGGGGGGMCACSLASGSPARTRGEDRDVRRRARREDPTRAIAAEHVKP